MRDFDMIQKLGSGSFGIVYKVRRKIDNLIYVIKRIRIGELSYQEQVDAINEVRLLSEMDCPYIVKYYDSFIEEENLNIVMEYCNRGDLQSLLKKAKDKNSGLDSNGVTYGLREKVTWNVTLQVICGLYYLHKKKVLHRDLKTANVFLTREDEESSKSYFHVKIGDLGVAKLLETSTAFAQTIVGTPYYLSPELCSDKPYRDKSDCWALGVLIYECCTLSHPFEARNQYALIMKILQSPVIPPSPFTTSLELTRLILWLLQKDPNNRPSIRDILCEVYIRRQLQEHNIPLPDDELETQVLTNHLGAITESISPRSHRNEGSSTLSGRLSTKSNGSDIGGVSNKEKGNDPVKSKAIHSNKKQQQVRGDRVRGPITQPRLVSDKARSRYQVKPPIPSSDHNYGVNSNNNNNKAITRSIQQISLEDKPSSENEIPGKLISLSSLSSNSDRNMQTMTSIQANYDEEEYYDEDFEEYDENNLDDNEYTNRDRHSSSSYDMVLQDDGEMIIHDHVSNLFEASICPKSTETIEQPRKNGSDSNYNHDDDDIDSSVGINQQIEALKTLIRDTRQKSHSALGDKLFFQLYDLCKEYMTKQGSGNDLVSQEKQNADIVRSIESALYEQLNGGIEVACEAVFNMKVLLALEHRLDLLLENQS